MTRAFITLSEKMVDGTTVLLLVPVDAIAGITCSAGNEHRTGFCLVVFTRDYERESLCPEETFAWLQGKLEV